MKDVTYTSSAIASHDITLESVLATMQEFEARHPPHPIFGRGPPKFYEDANLVDVVQAPRLPKSRKKRIRNKWRKKYPQTRTIPKQDMYVMDSPLGMGKMILIHPITLTKLLKDLAIETARKVDDAILMDIYGNGRKP